MLDAYRDLIDDLIDAPTEIKQRPPAGEAAGHLRELIDADNQALIQLQQLTRTRSPLLKPVPPITAAGETDPATLVDAFDTARGELVSLLMNLTLKDWEATGIDTDGAEISVADLVERHVELDETIRAELNAGA